MRVTYRLLLAAMLSALLPAAHTPVPEITVTPQSVDFETAFAGGSVVRAVTVANTGTTVVTMGPLSATPDSVFSAFYQGGDALGGFELAPGARHTIVISFSPPNPGGYDGTLSVTSSVPQQFVSLTGNAVNPPEMSASPESFSVEIEAGAQAERTLTISNDGPSELEFSVAVLPAPPTGPALIDARPPHGAFSLENRQWTYTLPEHSARTSFDGGTAAPAAARPSLSSTMLDPSADGVLYAVWWEQFIVELDPGTGAVLDTIVAVGASDGSDALAFDGRYLYYRGSEFEEGVQIVRIDPLTKARVDTAHVDVELIGGLAHSGTMLYALGYETGTLYAIDYESATIVQQIIPNVQLLGGLSYGGSRQTLFATNAFDRDIYEIDPASGVAVNTLNAVTPGFILSAAYSRALGALILGSDDGTYYVVDPDDGTLLNQFAGHPTFALAGDETGVSPFMATDPTGGTVPAGAAVDLSITFDASDLFAGTYAAQIRIFTNEPKPQPSRSVSATLHVSGAPVLSVADTLQFPLTYIGAATTRALEVRNVGTDSLTVTAVGVAGEGFSVAMSEPLRVPPGENRSVPVRYEPAAVGFSEGSVTVSTDGGEAAVHLSGEAAEAPIITVAPDSILVNVSRGHQATRTLVVRNVGGSTLEWSSTAAHVENGSVLQVSPAFSGIGAASTHAAGPSGAKFSTRPPAGSDERHTMSASFSSRARPVAPPPLAKVLENFNAGATGVTSTIPDRFHFDGGRSGTFIDDGGGDMYDGGNVLSTDRAGGVPYSGGAIAHHPAFGGTTDNYFTRKVGGLFVLAADLNGVESFVISGDLGADGEGSVDGSILETQVAGRHFQIFLKRVYGAFDPSVNHMVIVEGGVEAGHEFATNSNEDYHRVYGLTSADRLYYLLYAGTDGRYIDNEAALGIANAFLGALGLTPDWISVHPADGFVEPGDSSAIEVRLDAGEREPDRYVAELLTFGNGLDSTAIRTRVTMDVALNVAVESPDVPRQFELDAGYPNPAGPSGTTISYALPRPANVRLDVYDALGRHVTTLVDEQQAARRYQVRFDTSALPSGMYLYRIEAGGFRHTRSLLVLR